MGASKPLIDKDGPKNVKVIYLAQGVVVQKHD